MIDSHEYKIKHGAAARSDHQENLQNMILICLAAAGATVRPGSQ